MSRTEAVHYSKTRRMKEPALYNKRRLREKPIPETRSNQMIPMQSIEQSVQSVTHPKRVRAPKNQETRKLSPKRREAINSCDDVADVSLDTPPNSPIAEEGQAMTNSTEDIICLTTNLTKHKPFGYFDVISGRVSFTLSVGSEKFDTLVLSTNFVHVLRYVFLFCRLNQIAYTPWMENGSS